MTMPHEPDAARVMSLSVSRPAAAVAELARAGA